ncbi:MAG: hypothetical protein WKG07_13125 [Hymenobacter sp.]
MLPPEVNMTVKDGFRFGIGFILASLIFYVIVLIGVVVIVRFGRLVGLGQGSFFCARQRAPKN